MRRPPAGNRTNRQRRGDTRESGSARRAGTVSGTRETLQPAGALQTAWPRPPPPAAAAAAADHRRRRHRQIDRAADPRERAADSVGEVGQRGPHRAHRRLVVEVLRDEIQLTVPSIQRAPFLRQPPPATRAQPWGRRHAADQPWPRAVMGSRAMRSTRGSCGDSSALGDAACLASFDGDRGKKRRHSLAITSREPLGLSLIRIVQQGV